MRFLSRIPGQASRSPSAGALQEHFVSVGPAGTEGIGERHPRTAGLAQRFPQPVNPPRPASFAVFDDHCDALGRFRLADGNAREAPPRPSPQIRNGLRESCKLTRLPAGVPRSGPLRPEDTTAWSPVAPTPMCGWRPASRRAFALVRHLTDHRRRAVSLRSEGGHRPDNARTGGSLVRGRERSLRFGVPESPGPDARLTATGKSDVYWRGETQPWQYRGQSEHLFVVDATGVGGKSSGGSTAEPGMLE